MLSLPGWAQEVVQADSPPRYRWYVGLHAGFQAFRTTSVYTAQEGIIRPGYGYWGYQFTPHVAVQAGFQQRHQQQQTDLTSIGQNGQLIEYIERRQYFNAAVPVLLRFRLARRPTHRLHLDALLGPTLLLHRFHQESYSLSNQAQNQFQQDLQAANWYLTGGLGLGFNLTPHLELAADLTNNWYLNPREDYRWVVQPGAGIGLRYAFNLKKEG
ncbi:outer membrane beta-barrel protein [Hymenobacter rubidus]|uniref:outer membrane beta-barrel protein n=1 Tax=Hymenobacter rubidus TaxID=1441626 RepID=UPI00191FAEB7|nr:outer membrane beta-barrel protein [Hymenobacter rubidus]